VVGRGLPVAFLGAAGVLGPVAHQQGGVEMQVGRTVLVVGVAVGAVVELATLLGVREQPVAGGTSPSVGSGSGRRAPCLVGKVANLQAGVELEVGRTVFVLGVPVSALVEL